MSITDTPETTEPVEALDFTGDLIAALTTRFDWTTDEQYARTIQRKREHRDQMADAHARVARLVVELDLPWPHLSPFVYRDRHEGAVIVASWDAPDLETFRLLARTVRRELGGMAAKANDEGALTASLVENGVAWDVKLTPEQSPCEQVQVGTETRVEREEVSPPRYREVEKEVPVYEWRCPDSILDAGADAEPEDTHDVPDAETDEA